MSKTPATESDHLQTLPAILPSLLRGSSVSRAQIIVDQLKTAIQAGRQDLVHLLYASSADAPPAPDAVTATVDSDTTDAAVVLIRQPPSDAATLLAGGFLLPAADTLPAHPVVRARLAADLSRKIDRLMQAHAITFLQWATDPVEIPITQQDSRTSSQNVPAAKSEPAKLAGASPAEFGFENAATLQYLSGGLDGDSATTNAPDANRPAVALHVSVVDSDNNSAVAQFSNLVGATYVGSLDCPKLSSHRTASEIVASYRTAASYRPGWWMTLAAADDPATPIGCLIMACHGGDHSSTAAETGANDSTDPAPVAELVYMGLLPEYRGRGLGRRIVETARATARAAECQRMILAVDLTNGPAVDAYQTFGMTPVMKETVWVKSVPPVADSQPSSS